MKLHSILLVTCCIASLYAYGQQEVIINASESKGINAKLVSSINGETIITITTSGFTVHDAPEGRCSLSCPGGVQILERGYPDLPQKVVSLIIPDEGTMVAEVLSSEYTELNNYTIAPSKGNIKTDISPEQVDYIYSDIYSKNSFWPSEHCYLRDPYVAGSVRGQALVVQPFAYNAVTGRLRIYTSLTIKVRQGGGAGINELHAARRRSSAEFNALYKRHFINFPQQYTAVEEEGDLLIICPQQWLPLMQPFVKWKRMKGIRTECVDLSVTGSSASDIRNYIYNYYQSHNLTHVLLAGDIALIPSVFPPGAGGPSDPSYGYINGNDSYPEVFIGRFPAETQGDLMTMVERSVAYEKYPDTTASWYGKAVCIGSNFGPGDDNEMDWEHESNIRNQLLAFTYTDVLELYDGTHPSTTDLPGDPSATDLLNAFQSGVSLINYTGHGTNGSFGTTGFSLAEVSQLTNGFKLPFIWSAGCTNGNFNSPVPCLGEALLRATANGNPAGAVAALMSSVNQFWSPPMDAQDEMNALLTESYINNIKRTFGGISYNGCMHMMDNYGAAGALMTDTWNCFGDPTLNVRTGMAQAITVSHALSLSLGDTMLAVSCSADGATVALTQNGGLLAVYKVTANMAELHFAPLMSMDSLTLVVTGFNLDTYMSKIVVAQPAGPYVIATGKLNNEITGNNNGMVDYGETIECDLAITNAGASASTPLTCTVVASDTNISIISSVSNAPSLFSTDSIVISSAFLYSISSPEDQHEAAFQIIIADTLGNQWTSTLKQVINAPALRVGNSNVDDAATGNGNGVLEPGESANIYIECRNAGHAGVSAAQLIAGSPQGLFLLDDTVTTGAIAAASSVYIPVSVSLSPLAPQGSLYNFNAKLESGLYSDEQVISKPAGYIYDYFESGSFSANPWQVWGNVPWLVTDSLPYSGSYCAQSGNVDDNESSILSILIDCLSADSLTFMVKVSSEATWDALSLYVDSTWYKSWSGNLPWTYDGVPVTAGLHTIEFIYAKDNILSSGSDCAWLDDVRFPPHSAVTSIETMEGNKLFCYPVPADDFIYISRSHAASCFFSMINAEGKQVYSCSASGAQLKVPVSALPDGIYFLSISEEGTIYSRKIIVQHP